MPKTRDFNYPEILGHAHVVTEIDGDMVTFTSVGDDGETPEPTNGEARVRFNHAARTLKIGERAYLQWKFRNND